MRLHIAVAFLPAAVSQLKTGTSICTNAPDTECWPSTGGWPPCCSENNGAGCPSQEEFVMGVNPPCEAAGNETMPMMGGNMPMMGGNMPMMGGTSICTNAPDTECWPSTNGWPPCCSENNGAGCPSQEEFVMGVNPPCEAAGNETMPMMGGSICTNAPDTQCWPSTGGWPACCSENNGADCPSQEEFVVDVNPPCEAAGNETMPMMGGNMGGNMPMMGGSICTNAPDTECWPSTGGWPPCCSENNGAGCPSQEEFVMGVNPPCEGKGAGSGMATAGASTSPESSVPALSSSTTLVSSLITLVGFHAIVVAGVVVIW